MAEYKGLNLVVDGLDSERRGYYEEAKAGRFVVQKCAECGMLRGAIGAGCPFCTCLEWSWQQVSGKGTIYSYQIAVNPVQPAFRDWSPYPIILVELDEQRNVPWNNGEEGETVSVRVVANLVTRDDPMRPEAEENVKIGERVEVVFVDLDDTAALPQFRLAASN